ncbi:MAG: polyprenyl synthetase family protein [Clostridia bacterium]|nr:polyprenyl synthetase family protein [Clostridia bacterium]
MLKEAMGYSLLHGGKRFRPVLLLASCDLFGGDVMQALPFACAIEMIHAYSLIHDDLPCMDDDDLRRGRPTNHRVFGEDLSVLAGDGLLSLAFELMASETVAAHDPRRAALAMAAIARGAGVSGMVSGQVRDIRSTGHEIGINELRKIHGEKTGAMISGACLAGAILGGADINQRQMLDDYGKHLGTAFQIQDDILDATQTAEVLGKTPGKDAQAQKNTFVTMFGLEEANAWAKRSAEMAFESLRPFGRKADFLQKTALFTVMREH